MCCSSSAANCCLRVPRSVSDWRAATIAWSSSASCDSRAASRLAGFGERLLALVFVALGLGQLALEHFDSLLALGGGDSLFGGHGLQRRDSLIGAP